MPKISINGMEIKFSGIGSDIKISNSTVNGKNKIYINGNEISQEICDEKIINITIEGNVNQLTSENGDIEVKGDVEQLDLINGNIKANNITHAKTMNGNIQASKIENAKSVNGNIY